MKKSTSNPNRLPPVQPYGNTFPLPDIQLADVSGQPFDIPYGGSIGLLALGDLGTIAWRQKLQQLKSALAHRTRNNLAEDQNHIPSILKNGENEKA